jgi:hypothetical protein
MNNGPFQGRVRDTLVEIRSLLAQMNKGTSPSSSTVEGLLSSIDANLVNIETVLTNDVATEATLLQVYSELGNATALLTGIETNQQDQLDLFEKANWTSIVGNSIEITYYSGVAAGNPSGSTSNIETTVYKTGASVAFTQTMTYNAANLVTSVTTT